MDPQSNPKRAYRSGEKNLLSIPTYWIGHNLLPFAANRNHIGLYPGPEAVKHFAPQLEKAGYPYSKGTIKISDTEPLPLKRIAEIARWCYRREKNA